MIWNFLVCIRTFLSSRNTCNNGLLSHISVTVTENSSTSTIIITNLPIFFTLPSGKSLPCACNSFYISWLKNLRRYKIRVWSIEFHFLASRHISICFLQSFYITASASARHVCRWFFKLCVIFVLALSFCIFIHLLRCALLKSDTRGYESSKCTDRVEAWG